MVITYNGLSRRCPGRRRPRCWIQLHLFTILGGSNSMTSKRQGVSCDERLFVAFTYVIMTIMRLPSFPVRLPPHRPHRLHREGWGRMAGRADGRGRRAEGRGRQRDDVADWSLRNPIAPRLVEHPAFRPTAACLGHLIRM